MRNCHNIDSHENKWSVGRHDAFFYKASQLGRLLPSPHDAGNSASWDFYVFLRSFCGSFAENYRDLQRFAETVIFLCEITKVLRRFEKTTNPRNNSADKHIKSWLVKFPITT